MHVPGKLGWYRSCKSFGARFGLFTRCLGNILNTCSRYEVHTQSKFQSRPEMVRAVGRDCACITAREGVCANNAVQFQSCDGCSYCTAQGENCCTDIVSRQLQFTKGLIEVHDEDRIGRPSQVMHELIDSVRKAVLQNRHFTMSELCGQFLQMSHSLCRPRWSRGYHTRHWIRGSRVQTRPGAMDFSRA